MLIVKFITRTVIKSTTCEYGMFLFLLNINVINVPIVLMTLIIAVITLLTRNIRKRIL